MGDTFFTHMCKTEALWPWATNRDKDEIVWAAVWDTRRLEEKEGNQKTQADQGGITVFWGWFDLIKRQIGSVEEHSCTS